MPPQSNSCFNHYITIIFNCKGFFINIFWICVYVRFFGLVLLLNLRYQLDVCVGANTIRPSKKQAHGNNKVRQQKKFSPTILNLQQILSTGEHCSPLQIVLERFFCRKIATLGACPHLCSALPIPHFSLLTPHLIPLPPCILPHFRL